MPVTVVDERLIAKAKALRAQGMTQEEITEAVRRYKAMRLEAAS